MSVNEVDHATAGQVNTAEPNLGCATTRQLLGELVARLRPYLVEPADGEPGLLATAGPTEETLDLDYSTVAGERGRHLEDSRLVAHARRELELCGQAAQDPRYAAAVVRAVKEFASYGHSGGSAGVAVAQLARLLLFEPLSPITSDPGEWLDRSAESGYPLWQNVRDGRAMSGDGGHTWWYVEGRHAGERCYDNGRLGTLEACRACGGDGLVHRPDDGPAVARPQQPQPEPESPAGAGAGAGA